MFKDSTLPEREWNQEDDVGVDALLPAVRPLVPLADSATLQGLRPVRLKLGGTYKTPAGHGPAQLVRAVVRAGVLTVKPPPQTDRVRGIVAQMEAALAAGGPA